MSDNIFEQNWTGHHTQADVLGHHTQADEDMLQWKHTIINLTIND